MITAGHTDTKALVLLLPLLALVALGGAREKQMDNDGGFVQKSFTIDYDNDQFLKDGEPFRYISGSIHYFRVPPTEWRDRLQKLRMGGFNALETYVEWSSHEPEPGSYDFTGILDLEKFITIAQEEDLVVILRVGPYMDAERDMGGLPYWLLNKNPDMRLRSSDPTYLKYVDTWFSDVLLPKLKPLLYENGGPIIMVQVENEYGSYPYCDFSYTSHVRDLLRESLGEGVVLFTTDGDGTNYLRCGKVPGVYATIDFGSGSDVDKAFAVMRLFEPRGPLVNSEYYPGWLDYWGVPHNTVSAQAVAKTLDKMLALNASVNMYMFHGGTSFGLTAGSDLGGRFQACPTSYDYDAPLSEAGDPTEKYWVLRNVTSKYLPLPPGEVPDASSKYRYGKVSMTPVGSTLQMASLLQKVTNKWPLTFEDLMVPNGMVVYQTVLPFRIADPARLTLNDIHDRAYIFVDTRFVGMLSREQSLYDLPISALPNQTISIVAESQGRICYGPHINDFKGITTNVSLSDHTLEDWTMTPLPLTSTARLMSALIRLRRLAASQKLPNHHLQGTERGGMTFYEGTFEVPDTDNHPRDTFLRLDGWGKGIAWVNDFCLGRYWPDVGPQVTLYVPRSVLQHGINTLMLLEQEYAPCLIPSTCYATLEETHVVDGPTPF